MNTSESGCTWLKNSKTIGRFAGMLVLPFIFFLTPILDGSSANAEPASLPILRVDDGKAQQQLWTPDEFKSFVGDTAATAQTGIIRAFTRHPAPACHTPSGSTSYDLTMIIVSLDLSASLKFPTGQNLSMKPAFRLTFTKPSVH